MTWKQHFEKFIEEELNFDPNVHDIDELRSKLEAAETTFQLDHKTADVSYGPEPHFQSLTKSCKLELLWCKTNKNELRTIPVRDKISDADSLKQCIKTTDVLTTLMLQPT